MSTKKIPGEYVVEKKPFPSSVVEVATAVPAFIGYTEKAIHGAKSLLNTPWKVNTLAEFEQYFGGAPTPVFSFSQMADTVDTDLNYSLVRIDSYNLYYNLKFFFANGGRTCYIVSVGSYIDDVSGDQLASGIDTLLNEQEPTMVLVPEAVCLKDSQNCYDIQKAMLTHCGKIMKRVAILDVYEGFKSRKSSDGDVVTQFREQIGVDFLDYAAAYYPWLHTSIVGEGELSFLSISKGTKKFKAYLESYTPHLSDYIDQIDKEKDIIKLNVIHKVLYKECKSYASIMKSMVEQINLLPPSAAMAGIYSITDLTKEVWKAPANKGLANVIRTAVNISHEDQEDLNVPLDGKAVNAIRYFTGEGIKVWGARTLDGNSPDWRYINVRRTMIMLQESIKNAAIPFAFDPNVANTWVIVKSTISNFLNGIWKRGGLAGAVPEDSFSVHIGLGETMTPEDVLEGRMRITVLVAISRPAEFIEITFMQQMQKS